MSQKEKILNVLADYEPHSSFEIVERAYGIRGPSLARLGARIWDLRKAGYQIESWRDKENHTKHWYQLRPPGPFVSVFHSDLRSETEKRELLAV